MSIGIILKGLNAIHFRQRLDFIFEFIPQICLLLALFGWMDVLIIAKWLEPKQINTNWNEGSKELDAINYSPAIITTMIDIFLKGGSNKKDDGSKNYNYLFPGQQ